MLNDWYQNQIESNIRPFYHCEPFSFSKPLSLLSNPEPLNEKNS